MSLAHPQIADDPVSLLIPGFLALERRHEDDIKFRHLRAILDGQLLSILNYGDDKIFSIRPGQHELIITNTMKKIRFEFEVGSGETVRFSCRQNTPNWGYFLYVMLGVGPMKVYADRIEPDEAKA